MNKNKHNHNPMLITTVRCSWRKKSVKALKNLLIRTIRDGMLQLGFDVLESKQMVI